MVVDLETYKTKAQEAIEYVFSSEYHNSLGIPMPEVQMLLADDENYSTGQYYITIDKTWQIHLNFGKLPVSYKEFQDEVKVLTRHEIEHYMCCPFDVITHLRMLKCIRNIYYREYSHLGINIEYACGSIANQAADIIVDTKNFYLHPQETLQSEINWIKKGANIAICPRHNKLMFLTKEAIWGCSLDIKENDAELLKIVAQMAKKFKENGIDDKSSFLSKTEEYTRAFFNLYIRDKKEGNDNQGDQQGQSSSGNQQQGGQQGQLDLSNQQQGQFSIGPKDKSENGSAFVFADPDKIKEAIEALAHETELNEFVDLLGIAGLGGLSCKDREKLWFIAQSSDIIPIEEETNTGNPINYSYPNTWRIGDPIESLDLILSYITSPKLIPGITTKKWERITTESHGSEKKLRDLLLVVDTSGSMKSVTREADNMHQAVLASFGILNYFESKKCKVALIEFSDSVRVDITWTVQYDEIREKLLTNGSGGTQFPIHRIQSTLEKSKNELVTVVITDGELGNLQESITYFREYLNEGNKLYIFLLGSNGLSNGYDKLSEIGAKVYKANGAREFCNLVLTDLE
ncbi:von Willebrand factor type A domain protein [Prevotella melaninogenica]|uniref:vWA domain-containing protein n=1 Tax=Prevotella melaninogenica TaxID=28132 RepID=UPI0019566D19|nr:VWA domain-containing protein [Prevotella melaninogenica]VTY05111.1 von Willebrand factor type A domain protein [Prevotella melaninogenica]